MLGDIFSPLSVLKTFTMIELIEQIVGSTNTYAGMIINIPKIQERISQTKKVCLTFGNLLQQMNVGFILLFFS